MTTPAPGSFRRPWHGCALAGLALLLGSFGLSGCTSLSIEQDFATVVALAPAPVVVPAGHELAAAEQAAGRINGGRAYRGVGESMMPLYTTGTAIVVVPWDFRQLRAGMTVLYVNHEGRGVAHVLTSRMIGGWTAQGVANAAEDPDLVTPRNLVGVVAQAYASSDSVVRRNFASRLSAHSHTSQLALNVPGVIPTFSLAEDRPN
ncbi:MAG TPA: hypothetical protein PLU52_03475 [Opitutaceae bacterium]|nr:hypothetical protein [Opitutaceae bacterium]HND61860.1 hypothetical protein [Opitutaceae bacterium]